ncbi:MAG: spore germination protein GerW family protein [Actinomycetota bacterium]
MKIVDTIAGVRDAMTVGRVFGEAYEKDEVTIIPAAFVAGGGGGGGDEAGNGGGGFGLAAFPVGAYIIKDGNVTWRPALNLNLLIPAALMTLRTIVQVRAKRRR